MTSWILQHFLNPAFFWPGMALLAAPIIIHLINRMRYRRVRFAAMEFLLASRKRNRRRILIEQLLLLLLRIVMMLLIVLLLARLIIDPEQLSLFQGAKSHHVVILDDTASMRDRDGEESAFDVARETLRRIAAEGARRPGSQLLTLVLMTDPDRTLAGLSERLVDESLLTEITERLTTIRCSHQAADPAEALEAARRRLADDRSAVRQVHVLSDFRSVDWSDNRGAVAAVQAMERAKIGVNLVRCVAEAHENLSVTELGGAVEAAAAGVPVTLTAKVRNWGSRDASNVAAALFVNDVRLPRTVNFQTVPARGEATQSVSVVFDAPQPQTVRIALPPDALEADNDRFLAIDVPADNPVLLIDGSPGTEQALYVADALAADRSVTGYAPDIRSPEDLRRTALDAYRLIYLINVPELAPDAVAALDEYVRGGGGLIWYLGDAVRPAFYNETLFDPAGGLFPARLAVAPAGPDRSSSGPDVAVGQHPIFELFHQSEVPILDLVFVNLFYPLAVEETARPNIARDVNVLATVRGRPLMLAHRLGAGRVFTALTSAGPLQSPAGVVWNNWASGPAGFSFVVFQLELAKAMIRRDRAFPQRDTGEPIELRFNQALYQPEVEIVNPENQVARIQASRNETDGKVVEDALLTTVFRQTDLPGVYSVTLTGQDQEQHRQLFAYNIPSSESDLNIANDDVLLRELGPQTRVTIQPAGSFEWIRSESPGSEVRWFLLVALALVCIAEQWLGSRLSYQSQD